jgi:SagB-type dehydrogenase family enzyme
MDGFDDTSVWELYHENSKTSRYEPGVSMDAVAERMQGMYASLSYEQYPEVELPAEPVPLTAALDAVLFSRVSVRTLSPMPIDLARLATILRCAYGVTRSNEGTLYPRPFRVIPSAGALYPLEIYFYSNHVEGLAAGLYHYNPSLDSLRLLREGSLTTEISSALVDPMLAYDASVILFVTAMFERATFKYGERGYRFVLLEAGHLTQNVNLAVNALRLGCLNVGGYFDRELDDLLGLDGVSHSTIYLTAIGEPSRAEPDMGRLV